MKTNTLPPAAGQAAHTPTPWEAFDRYTNPETSCRIHYYDEKTGVILGTVCRDLSAANAAFIVRACNGFDQLVTLARNVANEQKSPHREQALAILSRIENERLHQV